MGTSGFEKDILDARTPGQEPREERGAVVQVVVQEAVGLERRDDIGSEKG